MKGIPAANSAADDSQACNAEQATDGKSKGLKRCMMTYLACKHLDGSHYDE
jgi:hypothetical protein